jgi:multidrug efflux pump subunit AcrB
MPSSRSRTSNGRLLWGRTCARPFGAREVAFPEFVSTISICIVFLPIFLLTGTAAHVFRPLALAVVFAMLASYMLARTLVPTLASLILPSELRAEERQERRALSWLGRVHRAGSGGTVAPNFWSDPATGSSYDVQVIAPPSNLDSVEDLLNLVVRPSAGSGIGVPLRSFASVAEKHSPASVSRTMMQPTFTVVGNASGRDIGGITRDLEKVLVDLRSQLKPGNRIELAGQAALMRSSYSELIGGLGVAAILVFLVMVVNFQSWTLPLVAISGLPVAISGALFSLWLTGTPVSVPGLMGIIMVVGVSTANSVLVTSFVAFPTDPRAC